MKRSRFVASLAASPLAIAIARIMPGTAPVAALRVVNARGAVWATLRLPAEDGKDISAIAQRALNLAATQKGSYVLFPSGSYTVRGVVSSGMAMIDDVTAPSD